MAKAGEVLLFTGIIVGCGVAVRLVNRIISDHSSCDVHALCMPCVLGFQSLGVISEHWVPFAAAAVAGKAAGGMGSRVQTSCRNNEYSMDGKFQGS